MAAPSSLRVMAITFSLALAAAAFQVGCSTTPTVPEPPQEINMPAIKKFLQHMAQQLRDLRDERNTLEALRALDARTLADIGVDPSEIGSIHAEWRHRASVTRLRIAQEPGRV